MKVLDYDGTDHLIDKIYDALNSGGSADYIVEEGRSGIWIYRKWASGVAECWGRQSATIDVTRAWGDGYISQALIGGDALPFTFYSIESAIVQNNNINGMVMSNTDVSTTNAPSFFIYRPYASQASVSFRFSYEIKGLWKAFTPSVSMSKALSRSWNFTASSGITDYNSSSVIAVGGMVIGNFRFKYSGGTSWTQIGTTTDIPKGNVDTAFPLINLANGSYLGEMQIRRNGTVWSYYNASYSADTQTTIAYALAS